MATKVIPLFSAVLREFGCAAPLPFSYRIRPGLSGYADLVMLSKDGDIYLDTILISNDNKE